MKSFEKWYQEDRKCKPTSDDHKSISCLESDLIRWEKEAYEAGQQSAQTDSRRYFFVSYIYRSPLIARDVIGNHCFEFEAHIEWKNVEDAIINRLRDIEKNPFTNRLAITFIVEIKKIDYESFVKDFSGFNN